MKKFISIVLVIISLKSSFVYADYWNRRTEKENDENGTATIYRLEHLVGKTIYRNVPAHNKTEYDTAYQNIPYTIDSYNENIVSLRDENEKLIILDKDLWDDGNWKEWVDVCNFKIGDRVKTINKYGEHFNGAVVIGKIINITSNSRNKIATLDNGKILNIDWLEKYNTEIIGKWAKWYVGQKVWDVLKGRGEVVCISIDNYSKIKVEFEKNLIRDWKDMEDYTLSGKYSNDQVQRLFPIETKSINFNLDKLFPQKVTTDTNIKEMSQTNINSIKKRLTCTRLIGSETFHMNYGNRSKYSCIECGHWLKEGAAENYYYCPMCCEGFCIEEKEVAVLSTKKQNGVVVYKMTDFHASCSSTYIEKYNLKKGDHVVWDKKCGRILVFDMNNATVAYCRGKLSPHYCRATDEIEYIGANNLTKSDKCFKYQ